MLIVQKFGGSSLAGIERLRRSAEICLECAHGEQDLVVVVSAMGDSTNALIDLARQISPRPSSREMDALMTTGEQQSAALMAIMLESLGAKARSLTGWQAGIFTDCRYGSADVELIAPDRIRKTLSEGAIAVVTGFQGFCACGDITSLGRGGSDTTAVALAAALEAGRCEIYTDVDGIFTADPRLISDAKKLDCIDFRDMLALSESGSQVLHPRSVELAMANDIPIHLLSSFSPGAGSLVRFLPESARCALVGITVSRRENSVTVAGRGADVSVLSEIVLLLGANGIAVKGGSLGENRVTVKVEEDNLLSAAKLIHGKIVKAL